MADDQIGNVKNLHRESMLRAWRRQLERDPVGARAAIKSAIERLRENGVTNWAELDRYWSQMKNGVAVPTDFTAQTRA